MTEEQGSQLLDRVAQLTTETTDLRLMLEQQHTWFQMSLGMLFIAVCAVVFFAAVQVMKR